MARSRVSATARRGAVAVEHAPEASNARPRASATARRGAVAVEHAPEASKARSRAGARASRGAVAVEHGPEASNARPRAGARASRGAVAVEFAMVMPILLLVVLAGVQLGRVLVTRHRLADATGYAARAGAVANTTDWQSVQSAVRNRLGDEVNRCLTFNVQAVVVPGAYPGSQALQVTTVCAPRPMFDAEPLSALAPRELRVVATMPL